MPLISSIDVLAVSELPSLSSIYTMDAVIAKIQVTLDTLFSKPKVNEEEQKNAATCLLAATFLLIEYYYMCIR